MVMQQSQAQAELEAKELGLRRFNNGEELVSWYESAYVKNIPPSLHWRWKKEVVAQGYSSKARRLADFLVGIAGDHREFTPCRTTLIAKVRELALDQGKPTMGVFQSIVQALGFEVRNVNEEDEDSNSYGPKRWEQITDIQANAQLTPDQRAARQERIDRKGFQAISRKIRLFEYPFLTVRA
jgi:hypothetical protein